MGQSSVLKRGINLGLGHLAREVEALPMYRFTEETFKILLLKNV